MSRIKAGLCFCVSLILMFALVGCGTEPTSATATLSSETVTEFNTKDLDKLMKKITESESDVEKVPVCVLKAKAVRHGIELTIDRLDYKERLGTGGQLTVTNKELVEEKIVISDVPLYMKNLSSAYVSDRFISYIDKIRTEQGESYEGVRFTFYMLDGQVLFISELTN